MKIAAVSLVTALTALALVAPTSPASAGRVDAPGQDGNHCSADSGLDLNELFEVPDQLVNRFCGVVSAGEHWRPTAFWYGDDGVDSVYPAGYTPTYAEPRADFLAKLTVEVVVDGGTSREQRYSFPAAEAVKADLTLDQFDPSAPSLPVVVTLPRMQPLSPGRHTRELIWRLSAEHCDGLTTLREASCIPAGGLSLGGALPLTATTPELS